MRTSGAALEYASYFTHAPKGTDCSERSVPSPYVQPFASVTLLTPASAFSYKLNTNNSDDKRFK